MHGRWSQSHDLEPIDLKLQKTPCTRRHIALKVKIEMNLEQQPQAPQERSFNDYFSQLVSLSNSCIRYLNIVVRSFKLKRSVLKLSLISLCLENENLYNHSNDFHDTCCTFKYESF